MYLDIISIFVLFFYFFFLIFIAYCSHYNIMYDREFMVENYFNNMIKKEKDNRYYKFSKHLYIFILFYHMDAQYYYYFNCYLHFYYSTYKYHAAAIVIIFIHFIMGLAPYYFIFIQSYRFHQRRYLLIYY